MLKISIDVKQLDVWTDRFPKQMERAMERSIDKLAYAIRDEVKAELPKVFDRPTPYTLNSLKVTPTKGHNMKALVGFKEPERMSQHYLLPEVEGGQRKEKGFEGALNEYYQPSKYLKLDRYGNVNYQTIMKILDSLTSRLRKGKQQGEYVVLHERHGKLPPGIYQRVKTGKGFGGKTKKALPQGEWQKGQTRGRFSSVIRAQGLRPIMIETSRISYRKRLPFYGIAAMVARQKFDALLGVEMGKVGLK